MPSLAEPKKSTVPPTRALDIPKAVAATCAAVARKTREMMAKSSVKHAEPLGTCFPSPAGAWTMDPETIELVDASVSGGRYFDMGYTAQAYVVWTPAVGNPVKRAEPFSFAPILVKPPCP